MLLCPPQHGKSTVSSKRFPAYMLGHDPSLDVISASATHPLAEEFGGAVRDCIASPEYQNVFGVALSEDSRAKGRWVTSEGGGYYAVGIGGSLFGRGAGLGIIDDPFATWEEAQSEVAKERVWGWYRGTFYNRIRPGGAIVVIQHRTSEDDLVGRLLEEQKNGGDKWEVVYLPADINNPPWPERYDGPALERIKRNTSLQQWSALYMQDPTPADGTFFKREWFKEWRVKPAELHIYGTSDYAVTDGGGDWTVHRIWGVAPNGDLYRLDGWRGQTSADEWIEAKLDLIKRHKPLAWFGESGVIQKAIAPMLKRRMLERRVFCRLEWLPSISDKPTRARGFQSRAAMGAVYFEPGADVEEFIRFPAGKHDDDVDNASLIGRALDEAHPAIAAPVEQKRPKQDRWAEAFGDHEGSESWKTA
jgi:predicted phage terminase large subunit-like protein